jgi:hypothetical protein
MRKLIVSFLLLAAGVSCRKPLFDAMPRWMHEQDRFAREERQEEAGAPEPVSGPDTPGERLPDEYLTAFQFPEGVPWRDSVVTGAELVLYKNGEEQLRLPVDGTPEPDRHRVVEGNLWTDAFENGQMVVACNGREQFSYPGEELYRGFLVLDGRVHTLGQRPGQGGFSYRIDGKEVYASSVGTVLCVPPDPDWPGGAFSLDGNAVYFTYALPVKQAESLGWEYHVMRGDELVQTLRAGEVDLLYDVRVFEGDVYRCERLSASAGSVRLLRGDTAEPLGFLDAETPHACRLVPDDKRLIVKGYSIVSGRQPYRYWYRAGSHNLYADSGALPPLALYRDADGTVAAVLLHPVDEQRVNAITLDKRKLELPPGPYRMTSSRCADFRAGRFSAALTAAGGNTHQVLHATIDSVWVDTYTFNGCFTSLQIQ